jgi:hypothetical protein
MRIISVRVEPVARVLAIAYSIFGVSAFVLFTASSAETLTLPLGIVLPLLHLNININLARSTNMLYNVFLCIVTLVSYAVTGWITGVTVALCFNAVAKETGGIDAKYVVVASDDATANPSI